VYFHERIRQAGVPVPELIAFDAHGGPEQRAAAIWQWIDGLPAEWRGAPCPYDEAELGGLLRRIHELDFDGPFGFLGDDPAHRSFSYTPDLPATSGTWPGFFRCDLAASRYFDNGYLSAGEADVLGSLPQRVGEALARAPRRLLHGGDIMHSGNLLVDPDRRRILAVIDYTDALVGDPRWELSWFDYYFDQFPYNDARFDLARFREAYGTEHDPSDPLGRFYLAAILVFEKLLFFRPGEPRTRWAIETLKGVLAEFAAM
jgi:hypothetical protein